MMSISEPTVMLANGCRRRSVAGESDGYCELTMRRSSIGPRLDRVIDRGLSSPRSDEIGTVRGRVLSPLCSSQLYRFAEDVCG